MLLMVCVGNGRLVKYLLAPFKACSFTINGSVFSLNQIDIEFFRRLSIFVSTVKIYELNQMFNLKFYEEEN